MKIWIKLAIASALGITIGLVLPAGSKAIERTFGTITAFALGFGRYALVPLLLFSIPVAVYELYEDRKLAKTAWHSTVFAFAAVCAAVLVGVFAPILVKPARIPLVAEAARLPTVPGQEDIILSLFPGNAFQSIILGGDFLLPLVILGFAFGLALTHDKVLSKPVVMLFDALSRIVYQINSFLVEVIAVLVIPIAAAAAYGQRTSFASPVYRSLLLVVAMETVFMAFAVLPLVIYLAGGKKNPFPRIYAMIGPVIAAAAGGQVLFSMGAHLRHGKENLGIRRRVGTVAIPLAIIFGRAGTALITSTAFIVVLGSYSNLGLSFASVWWVLTTVPFVMILLGAAPGAGPASAVMALCAMYGRGFESGYLLVVPVAVPLAACAAALDILTAGTAAFVVAEWQGARVERDIAHYI
ncbi:MAG: cation:dicarboxylase symporter family transporter [Spirochaetes bacterium]|nr:cation:dicarboxylase symporter family transporter [Spirochaetota bacterium]